MSAPGCCAREGAAVTGARTALAGWLRSLPLRRAVVCATGPFFPPTSLFVLGRVEVPCAQWRTQSFHSVGAPHWSQGGSATACAAAQWKRRRPVSCLCGLSFPEGVDGGRTSAGGEFVVVNFYHFVPIENPEAEVSKHQMFLQGRDVHGRIYINEQGINAQYSGLLEDALAYAEWLKEDDRFSGILIQISPTLWGHAFPRLKLRYKPSLVQLEGGVSHLPLIDPTMRATPLSPSEWRLRLQDMNSSVEPSSNERGLNHNRKILLLDVRNGYEWDIGHFNGAQRPDVDCFRSTTFGQTEGRNFLIAWQLSKLSIYMEIEYLFIIKTLASHHVHESIFGGGTMKDHPESNVCWNLEQSDSDPLAGVDKANTEILMYCTGGIRCDVYSTILRKRGYQNLFTLSGGVSHYLKSEGPVGWVGNLFVFDSRLSLPPSAYKPENIAEGEVEVLPDSSTFASCYICRSHVSELRHRNCANLDCNLLFLSCPSCMEELRGCCCPDCTYAPRLRPVHPANQRYEKWYIYRDSEMQRNSLA